MVKTLLILTVFLCSWEVSARLSCPKGSYYKEFPPQQGKKTKACIKFFKAGARERPQIFLGPIRVETTKGQLHMEGVMRDGKKHGPFTIVVDGYEGRYIAKGSFDMDQPIGDFKYYFDNELIAKGPPLATKDKARAEATKRLQALRAKRSQDDRERQQTARAESEVRLVKAKKVWEVIKTRNGFTAFQHRKKKYAVSEFRGLGMYVATPKKCSSLGPGWRLPLVGEFQHALQDGIAEIWDKSLMPLYWTGSDASNIRDKRWLASITDTMALAISETSQIIPQEKFRNAEKLSVRCFLKR